MRMLSTLEMEVVSGGGEGKTLWQELSDYASHAVEAVQDWFSDPRNACDVLDKIGGAGVCGDSADKIAWGNWIRDCAIQSAETGLPCDIPAPKVPRNRK
jgi:hypothetical protein